jgi:tocopherol cyclase
MLNKIGAVFNPERYHGWGKSKRYFEGWYYKIINEKEDKAFAIIPGVAMDENENKHAFIQVLDGKKLKSEYFKFDFDHFLADSNNFQISIKNNQFSNNRIYLDIPTINGNLNFSEQVPWPKKWYSPGIMGPYSFIPFMECNHGILSMDHSIDGKLNVNEHIIDFAKGKGYIEKDWGKSFPSAYIWMQSNHFNNQKVSIKTSIAKIPWLSGSFIGFICGLWVNNELIQFTTYNKTQLKKVFADKNKVDIVMSNQQYKIEIIAHCRASTSLASPISGFMDGRINESMTAKIEIKLTDNSNNKIIFEDIGRNAGLEVAGKVEELITN